MDNSQKAGKRQDNWSEHQKTMFLSLHEKQKVGKFCDVMLKCYDSEQTYNAHSCVLSSASPVLDKLLQDAMDKRASDESDDETSIPKLVVKLPADVSNSCIDSLLNFIYSGNVDLGIKQKMLEETRIKSEVGVTTRRTRKKSAGTSKPSATEKDSKKEDSSIEISSLYVFLKAARCLEIETLTEHLESAATLAKMKTGSTTNVKVNDRPPRRASAIRFQNSLRSSLVLELEQEKEEISGADYSPKSTKGRRRQSHSSQASTGTASKQKGSRKRRSSLKKAVKFKIPENPSIIVSDEEPLLQPEGQPGQLATPESNSKDHFNPPSESKDVPDDKAHDSVDLSSCDQMGIIDWDIGDDVEKIIESTEVMANSENWEPEQTEETNVIKNTKSSIFLRKRNSQKKKIETDENEQDHTCPTCGRVCTNSKNLQNHMKSHDRPLLSCTFCRQMFKYKTALKRHLLWHTGDGQKCHVCGKCVFSQSEMTMHMATHNVKKLRTQCTLCQKWFTSAYVMQLHMRTHTGTELFICQICGKKFPYKSSLKMHMMLHSGEKPYICSVCGKAFTQKIHAREHELQHAGYKRFQCNYCERYFAHKCGLKRHVADIHHKSRPYVCETCGKRFPRKTKLIEHTRIHTGEKPYICDICGVRYKANRSLKSHKKNRHNIVVPDYKVGICRKPPLPVELPETFEVEKLTFDFPIDPNLDGMTTAEREERFINNTGIAKEVDVVATAMSSAEPSPTSTNSREESGPHFQYPLHTNSNEMIFPIAQQETLLPQVLPQITTNTTLPSISLRSPSKTFIVPLNPNAASGFPVLCNQQTMMQPDQVSGGMMLTYMMPQEPVDIQEQTVMNTTDVAAMQTSTFSMPMARSASVPPMSTFRRHSGVMMQPVNGSSSIIPQASAAAALPGMHTFQPVHLPVNTISHQLLSHFTTVPAVSVLVPATSMPDQAVEMGDHPQGIIQQTSEWQTSFPGTS